MVEESRSGSAGGATQNPEMPNSCGASKESFDASFRMKPQISDFHPSFRSAAE